MTDLPKPNKPKPQTIKTKTPKQGYLGPTPLKNISPEQWKTYWS